VDGLDAAIRHAERVIADAASRDAVPLAEYARLAAVYKRLLLRFRKVMNISDTYGAELKKTTEQLEQVRALALPICMFCKKIRVDDGYWEQIEGYFAKHIDVAFTHGICPQCLKERYGALEDGPDARSRMIAEVQARSLSPVRTAAPAEDAAVRAAESLLSSPHGGTEQLRDGLRRLTDRYRKLLRRMEKILLISDGYQARLMDMNARLELLAHTDGLTGLSNRHDAMERLEAERSRAERHKGCFSVVITDVDGFKSVNDTRGHEAGDVLLSGLGRVFRTVLRREDACARWGGEEFLFLLPEADASSVEAFARKLLRAVRDLEIPYHGETLRCTVSAGCATFTPGAAVDGVLRAADAALYAAKHGGKDRFVGPE